MSKRTFFMRYLWLFDVIKNNMYITFKEIEEKFYRSILNEDEAGFSKRTFHRDLLEILELFGVEIKYDSIHQGYYIESEFISANTEMMINSYRLINSFQVIRQVDQYIASDSRNRGSEHLLLVLEAIKNRKRIEFAYRKYVGEGSTRRTVEPYFVKEFKGRWYVIANDTKDLHIKTFALERIEKDPIPVSPSACYDIPQDLTPTSYFKDSFGIFRQSTEKVEEVELWFKPLKGLFIKSQPLHASQVIIAESEKGLRVKLNLQVTHDFIMELLSHGSEVKVVAPDSLKFKMVEEYEKALMQYSE